MSAERSRPGVFASLRGALGTALTLLQTRLELLALELAEEKQRIIGLLLWGAVAVLALGMGLVFLAVFMTILLWDTHRLLVMGISAAVFCGLGLVAISIFMRLLHAPTSLFSASLAELAQDRAELRDPPA